MVNHKFPFELKRSGGLFLFSHRCQRDAGLIKQLLSV